MKDFANSTNEDLTALLAQTGPTVLPTGLSDRLSQAVVRDLRFRKNVRRAVAAGSMVCVLLAAVVLWPSPNRITVNEIAIHPATKAPAQDYVLEYSRIAAEEVAGPIAAMPGHLSFPSAEPAMLASVWVKPTRGALEPFTSSSAHAVQWVLKDLANIKSKDGM